MADGLDEPPATKASPVLGYGAVGLAIGLIWLGWQVVLVPLADRAPAEHAVRLSPGSAVVLADASESEWRAGRLENADALARMALERAPFNLQALRVVGLVEGETGDRGVADDLLTLAGNWSLRDDSSHSWLIDNRLRRGDYGSAFAHADTLARRRAEVRPQLFDLFGTAMESDPRSVPFLAGELADSPPWRGAFISSLYQRDGGVALAAQLAMLMKDSEGRFSDAELQQLYQRLYSAGQTDALRQVRTALDRPSAGQTLVDGRFEADTAILPFGWSLAVGAGYSVAALSDAGPPEVTDGPSRPSGALRVGHNGQSRDVLARQVTLLAPGRYRLTGRSRWELGKSEMVFAWQLLCPGADRPAGEARFSAPTSASPAGSQAWSSFSIEFQVPAEGCSSQTLQLAGENPGRRTDIVIWFSHLQIEATP
ncbi:hypothetical protein [Brevundimonas sp.]|uniref:hypothetical protein n=1 Tax=Brevundimonas sp. TaxID=1871086 RepID=UPI003AF60DBE